MRSQGQPGLLFWLNVRTGILSGQMAAVKALAAEASNVKHASSHLAAPCGRASLVQDNCCCVMLTAWACIEAPRQENTVSTPEKQDLVRT